MSIVDKELNKDEDGKDFEIGIYCVVLDFIALQFIHNCNVVILYRYQIL